MADNMYNIRKTYHYIIVTVSNILLELGRLMLAYGSWDDDYMNKKSEDLRYYLLELNRLTEKLIKLIEEQD